jgi:hypothetical protein
MKYTAKQWSITLLIGDLIALAVLVYVGWSTLGRYMSSIRMIFLPASIGPLLAIIPAFVFSKLKAERESWFLPFVHIPAIILWHYLVVRGYGAQSLGNMIEAFLIGGIGVAITYAKVFIVDRRFPNHVYTTYCEALLLMILAVFLRSFMPGLPE